MKRKMKIKRATGTERQKGMDGIHIHINGRKKERNTAHTSEIKRFQKL